MLGLEDGTLLAKLLGTEDGCKWYELKLGVMLSLEDGKVLGKSLVQRTVHHWTKGWAWRMAQCLCLHSV